MIVTGTAWIYYRSWVAVILLIPAGVWYYIQLLDECIKRKEQEFLVQFKELIQTFSSLLNTGYSVENAVKESLKEMQVFLTLMMRQFYVSWKIMVRQIRVQVPVEQAVERTVRENKASRCGKLCRSLCHGQRESGGKSDVYYPQYSGSDWRQN